MATDYAHKKTTSRLRRVEKKHAVRNTLIFIFCVVLLMLLFGFLGINLLAKLSLLVSRVRAPKSLPLSQDTIPPTAPQLSVPNEATSSALVTLTGYAEPGSLVHLYISGTKTSELTSPENGEIAFPQISLENGLNSIYAIAFDTAGNESPRSSTITIVVDDTPPALKVVKPLPGAIFYGTTEQTITLEGQTDPENSLTLNNRIIVTRPDGSFITNYELSEGENDLVIIAQDQAGNQTTENLKVSFSP